MKDDSQMPIRLTIDITYKGEEPDHTSLLDVFQDYSVMKELLSPHDAILIDHEVTVQELKEGMKK